MEPERSSTKSTSAGSREPLLVCEPQFASPVGATPVEFEPADPPWFWPDKLPSNFIVTDPAPPPRVPPAPTGGGSELHPAKKSPIDEKIAVPATIIPMTSFFMTSP
jgi:hypothetical protein